LFLLLDLPEVLPEVVPLEEVPLDDELLVVPLLEEPEFLDDDPDVLLDELFLVELEFEFLDEEPLELELEVVYLSLALVPLLELVFSTWLSLELLVLEFLLVSSSVLSVFPEFLEDLL
jgi:hypothetical protein